MPSPSEALLKGVKALWNLRRWGGLDWLLGDVTQRHEAEQVNGSAGDPRLTNQRVTRLCADVSWLSSGLTLPCTELIQGRFQAYLSLVAKPRRHSK
jgi:hypothetical protein